MIYFIFSFSRKQVWRPAPGLTYNEPKKERSTYPPCSVCYDNNNEEDDDPIISSCRNYDEKIATPLQESIQNLDQKLQSRLSKQREKVIQDLRKMQFQEEKVTDPPPNPTPTPPLCHRHRNTVIYHYTVNRYTIILGYNVKSKSPNLSLIKQICFIIP